MFFYNESDSEPSQISGGSTDEHFDNVSLLLNMDSDFSDSSSNNIVVTQNGGISINSTEYKYGGGSSLFTSTKYLVAPNFSGIQLGTQDFTMEAWVKQTSAGSINLFGIGPANFGSYAAAITDQGALYQAVYGQSVNTQNSATGLVSLNTWHHVAFVRSSGTLLMFLDGNQVYSTAYAASIVSADLNIGALMWGSATQTGEALIDDVRITKGVARYTANFTPPTEAHPTEGTDGGGGIMGSPGDPSFANVQLLLPLDTDFSDASANSHTVTGNGNASIYSGGKFGGALELDGNDFLNVTATPELAIGTQDFTLEMWVKRNGGPNDKFYMFNVGGLQNGAFAFYVQNGYLEAAVYPTGYTSPTMDVAPGVWTHVAVTRESGTIRIFADGNQVHSATDNSSIVNQDLKIGGQVWNQYNDNVGGFIDDVRLTIGEARYTANFTPPTEAHPTS